MNTPAPALLLVCPTCGKKYQGDPTKPNASYKCPADQAELVRPASSTDTVPIPPPTASSSAEQDAATQRITQPVTPPTPPTPTPNPAVRTQQLDLSDIKNITNRKITLSDDQATRVITSSTADDEKTRVISSSPTAQPSMPSTQPGTLSGTTIGTLREERRSVLAMIHGTDSPTAALLKDKYEIVGKLGQGGVGEVLKVVDRDLKREVAMKKLLPQSQVAEDAVIRFIEEAQATGQLEHPNIVPVHDLGVDAEGQIYFTLKYVQGASLKKVIKARNDNSTLEDGGGFYRDRYSAMRMVEILIAMCQAVAYAHSKGIIHRDLKPDNVMLGKYGEVLVMDWGLAKVIGKQTKSTRDGGTDTVKIMTSRTEDDSTKTMEGSIAGTPAYMSPEQAEGKISELDQRTDIYALGAILYEILSGQPPYKGGGALQLVKQVIDGPPPALKPNAGTSGFRPIPRELKAICEKAMAREPEDRYATASLMRDDLQAFLENKPVSAAPDTKLQQAVKWVRRNQRQVKTSALSVALVIALVFGTWFGWRQYTIYKLVNEGHSKLNQARDYFKNASAAGAKIDDNDPYKAQTASSALADRARIFRTQVNGAIEPLRRVLDISPSHSRARLLLAESYMELWRVALAEENTELARATRRDVERYAPDPSPFANELNGFGSLRVALEPPNAEAYLFTFETLRAKDPAGKDLPARLIPVPFDPNARRSDAAFLESELKRIAAGQPVPNAEATHSVFNLTPSAASKVGTGNVQLASLAPGSYMLLLKAPGRLDIRVPIRMPRNGKIDRQIELPLAEDAPAGFFFMAGGEITVGGTTAGAPAPRVMNIPASWIYHDEITMSEYAQFLVELTRKGRGAEARQRLPKDFGRNLATLNAAGQLVPTDGGDIAAFAKSPARGLSYNDAIAYLAWRSEMDGLPYRLPKDWEWEAACRGADARTYSWGNTPGQGLAVVTQGYGDTGTNMSWKWEDYKDESPWGVHNLAGGAAEWTMTKYDPKAKPEDPVFGQLAIRGNAWALPPVGLECAFRTSGQPDYFHPTIGFRMALDHPVKRIGPPTGVVAEHSH